MPDKYNVDIATNDPINLREVLESIATRPGHVRIVSVIYQPGQPAAKYVIISENEVEIEGEVSELSER